MLDNDKAEQKGVTIGNALDNLSTMVGSNYETNFIKFDRQYKVMVQALLQYRVTPEDILQNIKETENKINLLLGRYPAAIAREKIIFLNLMPSNIKTCIPSQLLANRPDIKKAELELAASKIDVTKARAEYYPSFGISAALGLQAFKPSYLFKLPESILYT